MNAIVRVLKVVCFSVYVIHSLVALSATITSFLYVEVRDVRYVVINIFLSLV